MLLWLPNGRCGQPCAYIPLPRRITPRQMGQQRHYLRMANTEAADQCLHAYPLWPERRAVVKATGQFLDVYQPYIEALEGLLTERR